MPLFRDRAAFGGIAFLLTAGGAWGQGGSPTCAQLLQAQDAKAVTVCKAELDAAEQAPAGEHMARIVANDEYGVALLGVAHKPRQSLEAFDSAVALLPASTVKPDSLQWAVIFWHRATAYQQLQEWERTAADLRTAENTFTAAIAGCGRGMQRWLSIFGNCASGYANSTPMCWSIRANTTKRNGC